MFHLLSCPQGHQCEFACNDLTPLAEVRLRCPICGDRVEATPPNGAEAAPTPPSDVVLMEVVGREAATLPPRAPGGAANDETATLPPQGPASAPGAEGQPRVAGYEILGELGRGGMGVVYQARHLRLDRLVALKMILAGAHAGAQELARFRDEARAVAGLQHPNIVQIFEVGEQDGRPFFALEFVDGGSLAQQLDGTPLPARRAAQLLETLARAMHVAHQKGIVHRDLKPANVLLTADGTPKVTDFGLAKLLHGAPGVSTPGGQTQSGAIVGTPEYMAPEQAGGKSQAIGPAADLYALGAILYTLLTGRPPFKAADLLDTLIQVATQEPVPPSSLQPKLERDLETICLKCLQKEPRKRYGSAQELAEDLARFLKDEPIRARPVGKGERLWRWCRRNPALAATASLAVLALLAGTAVSALFALAAYRARDLVEERNRLAETRLAENYLDRALTLCVSERDPAHGMLLLCQALESAPAQALSLRQAIRANLGAWRREVPTLRAVVALPGNPRPAAGGLKRDVQAVAFSPDGKAVLTGSSDGTAWLWLAATGNLLLPPLRHKAAVQAVAFSPDGKALLTATGAEWQERRDLVVPRFVVFPPSMAQLWSARTGRALTPPLPHRGSILAVAFSPDGKTVLTGGRVAREGTGEARLWSAATGKPLTRPLPHPGPVLAVAFSPDGSRLLTGSGDRKARLWSAATGQPLGKPFPHEGQVTAVAFSPDGRLLAIAGEDWTVQLWEAATGKPIGQPLSHQNGVRAVAFSADGALVLTGSRDQTARLWDAGTGRPLGPPLRHQDQVLKVAFAPHSRQVLTGSADNTVRFWELAPGPPRGRPLPASGVSAAVAFSPDGKVVVAGSTDGTARLWETATGRTLGQPLAHQGLIVALAFSPDGKIVLTGSLDRTARLWDATTGRPIGPPLTHGKAVRVVAFSADGKRALTGSDDTTARLWDTATGQPIGPRLTHWGPVPAGAFSPDGKTVLTGSQAARDRAGEAWFWDTARGGAVGAPVRLPAPVLAVAFRPDGKAVLLGYGDRAKRTGAARVWSAASRAFLTPPLHHQGPVVALAFRPDGKAVLTGSLDGTARLWDAATGQPIGPLLRHRNQVLAVAFSPDGKTVLTGSADRTARLWEPITGKAIGPPLQHPEAVRAVAFGPEGKTVLIGGKDARLWTIPLAAEGPAERINCWVQVLIGAALDQQETVHALDVSQWQDRRQRLAKRGGPPVP